jgi:cell division protein ZipA
MIDRQPSKMPEIQKEPKALKNNLLMLYLMAPENQPYNGYELLQALLSAGLRYGKMQIFHRHEQKTGRGDILFSLASATSPGTFELPKMGGFSCTGLVLFFETAKVKDAKKAFEVMIDTVNQLAEDLGGDILDEAREPLCDDKIAEIADSLGLLVERV